VLLENFQRWPLEQNDTSRSLTLAYCIIGKFLRLTVYMHSCILHVLFYYIRYKNQNDNLLNFCALYEEQNADNARDLGI